MSMLSFVLLFLALVVGAILVRAMSLRLRQMRQERLKAHLDWVNPEPTHAGRRRRARR
jgi:hypothetical protein